VISGVIEFAAITMAVYVAWKRTREDSGWVSLAVKGVAIAMLIDYPLLAVAYLTDRFGAFVEPIFFVCFSSWWLSNSWNRDDGQLKSTRSRSADCRRGLRFDDVDHLQFLGRAGRVGHGGRDEEHNADAMRAISSPCSSAP